MSGYQYNEHEPRGINAKSYEPEILHWIGGEFSEQRDCIADRPQVEHADYTPRAAGPHGDTFWVMGENGIEDEEPMVYGLSDDDLETLTIVEAPEGGSDPDEFPDLSVLC